MSQRLHELILVLYGFVSDMVSAVEFMVVIVSLFVIVMLVPHRRF